MSAPDWLFLDDPEPDDLPAGPPQATPEPSGRAVLGWVRYMFEDRLSGRLLPWDGLTDIAGLWDRQENKRPVRTRRAERIKIGSLVDARMQQGEAVVHNYIFPLWIRHSGAAFVLYRDRLLYLPPGYRSQPPGLHYGKVRWNYRIRRLMIASYDTPVKKPAYYVAALRMIWEEAYHTGLIANDDWRTLADQLSAGEETAAATGRIVFRSLKPFLYGKLPRTIVFLRQLAGLGLPDPWWQWGNVCMSPVSFARWLVGIDDSQPLFRSQQDVDVWKACLLALPAAEVAQVLALLNTQGARRRQIEAVSRYLDGLAKSSS